MQSASSIGVPRVNSMYSPAWTISGPTYSALRSWTPKTPGTERASFSIFARYSGPGERPSKKLKFSRNSLFPFGEKGGFKPGTERINTLFSFASRTGIFGMHVDTIRAAVDLRCADFD